MKALMAVRRVGPEWSERRWSAWCMREHQDCQGWICYVDTWDEALANAHLHVAIHGMPRVREEAWASSWSDEPPPDQENLWGDADADRCPVFDRIDGDYQQCLLDAGHDPDDHVYPAPIRL